MVFGQAEAFFVAITEGALGIGVAGFGGFAVELAGRLKKAVRYYRRAAEAGNKYAAKRLKRLDK